MNRTSRLLTGLLLILGGLLFLLVNFDVIPDRGWIWVGIFGIAGIGFLGYLLLNPSHWWPVIPGFTLLGLATLIGLSEYTALGDTWGATIFLGAIALSFWVIYIFTGGREWWALIPGGTMLTIALMPALDVYLKDNAVAGVFFLGLGLTFSLIYVLPSGESRQKWALIPGGIMLVMGALLMAAAVEIINYLWPIALVLGGLYLLLRALRQPA